MSSTTVTFAARVDGVWINELVHDVDSEMHVVKVPQKQNHIWTTSLPKGVIAWIGDDGTVLSHQKVWNAKKAIKGLVERSDAHDAPTGFVWRKSESELPPVGGQLTSKDPDSVRTDTGGQGSTRGSDGIADAPLDGDPLSGFRLSRSLRRGRQWWKDRPRKDKQFLLLSAFTVLLWFVTDA